MRIVLTANASYAPPRGGATRSNLLWLDHLASRGHQCRIVCGPSGDGAALACHPSIQLFAVDDHASRVARLGREIREFQPDWVLVSSEDLGHGLLREAHHFAPGRVVYLAHTPQWFPFGPASWNPDEHARELVEQSAGVVAIGHHMAEYIEHDLARAATVIHPPVYGTGPFPNHASFERGLVTMFNPCAVKGISIFLSLAKRLPSIAFGAVRGWGTTSDDLRALEQLPNIQLLPNAREIDDILSRTRVLLMPSLWYEGFGLIVMEAMLRGLPVVSSDSGGLIEAKRGTGYVIPVETIARFQPVFDEHAMPKPVAQSHDIEPWAAALHELLGDRAAYERESAASRDAAQQFISSLDAGAFERYLLDLKPSAPRTVSPGAHGIESLSPEKRALLLQRIQRRGALR